MQAGKKQPNFNVTLEEMMNFVGLIFLSGYNMRKSERDYWSVDPDLRCDAFPQTMSCNRFFELKSVLHAADNQSLSDSRMAKVEPLYNLLNEKLQANGIFYKNLSIDESMVPYYGRHSCKQFIRAKPIQFGYKLWVLASDTGIPFNIKIYSGKSENDTDEPLGTRVVKNALAVCEHPNRHSVFFNNFFSSYQLFSDLHDQGFSATGTLRKDRVMKCPLTDVKEMKKNERGSYDYRSDGKIEIVRWNDNSVVTLGSNAFSVEPLGTAKRWIKGIGKGNVDQPAMIAEDSKGMGGVDLLDRALSDLRPIIRGKKWYWPLIINALNIAFVYSWRIYQLLSDEKIPQKDHRRQVVSILIRRAHTKSCSIKSKPTRTFKVLDEIRFDGVSHYPVTCPVRKCVLCGKNSRKACEKCNLILHLNGCFQMFHDR